MKLQNQDTNNLFFDVFPRVQNEMKKMTDFKCLINNPFDHETHLKEEMLIKGYVLNNKRLEKLTTYQTSTMVIYCGLRPSPYQKGQSSISFLYVSKKTGKQDQKQTFIINDQVTSQTLGLVYTRGKPSLSYIIGTKSGSVKIYSFQDKPLTFKLKVHTVPVKYVQLAKQNSLFDHRSIALVLTDDQSIFITNLQKLQVVGQYKCGIIPLRTPIKILFHHSHQYFVQIFDDGCIHVWQIVKQAIEKINESHEMTKSTGLFKKFYGIIPTYQVHSVTTDGLIDCVFFGNFILVLTVNNMLKMIVLDKSIEQSYMTLFSEHIQSMQQTYKTSLNLKKIQILSSISSIFVLSDRHLFQFIYNSYDIVGMRVLTFEGIQLLEDFNISKEQLIIITGKTGQQFRVFIQKLNFQNTIPSVASNEQYLRKEHKHSNSNNLLIN